MLFSRGNSRFLLTAVSCGNCLDEFEPSNFAVVTSLGRFVALTESRGSWSRRPRGSVDDVIVTETHLSGATRSSVSAIQVLVNFASLLTAT
jgi:hypothetical protein